MKDHRVIRIKTGVGVEVLGKQGNSESGNQGDAESGNQANLSLSLAILHDNYRGLGYELGASLGTTQSVSEDFGASVGYYYNSFGGANFTFNTQLKGLPVISNLIGGNISTRAGLQSIQLRFCRPHRRLWQRLYGHSAKRTTNKDQLVCLLLCPGPGRTALQWPGRVHRKPNHHNH